MGCVDFAPLVTSTRVATSNLTSRLVTAGIASPILLALMFFGPPWAWFLLTLCGVGFGAWELLGMTHPDDAFSRGVGVCQSLLLSGGLYAYTNDARMLLSLVFGSTIVSVLLPLARPGEIPSAGIRMTAGIAAPFYISLLVTMAIVFRDMGAAGPGYVLMTLMLAWMADTGGYFAGRFFGKRKLYESISPKKTVEGFIGALAGAAFGALLASTTYLPTIPLTHALLLGLVAGCCGQLGDLAESLLKRSTAIKDSGTLLPGHGGVLDRVDSLLVVSPIVLLYTLWS